MKNRTLPTISIITVTYNSNLLLFKRVLKSMRAQNYPQRFIEHIVVDGGSRNGTVELATKYGCKILKRPDLYIQEHMRASLGFKKAKGDILLILQSDNLVTSKNWLRLMVQPFLENKDVFATYTAHYSYKKNMSATTRYGALIGANDPIISPYFLDKIEKVTMLQKRYNKGKIIRETSNYYVVKFNRENFPPLGDNGQMVLRSVMNKVNKDPKIYNHIDTFGKMFDLGYDTCGVIKSTIIHVIPPNILKNAKRRIQIKETFFDNRQHMRRFLIFDKNSKKDRVNLLKYVFFSGTIIVPLYQSIKGYLQIKDIAWFLHPVVCFVMLIAYGMSEMKVIFSKIINIQTEGNR